MTIDEFLKFVDDQAPPAPPERLAALERELGAELPADYRAFLVACNGGHVGGALWFVAGDAGVHHVGGFRCEDYLSLQWHRDCYEGRIPSDLLWIMDDPFGNAICLGLRDPHRGRVYFWDHETEPDPETWDGRVETADNVHPLADSFTEFVAGLTEDA